MLTPGSRSAIFAFQNGVWLWPGVRIGYEQAVSVHDGVAATSYTLRTLSLRPLVLSITAFMSPDEATHIIDAARGNMQRSGVVFMDGGGQGTSSVDADESRTSTSTYIDHGHSSISEALEERSHAITRLARPKGEAIQVVRYSTGQKYEAHRA